MAALPDLQRKLLTCEDYQAMIKAGILGEKDNVELIHGELIVMSPIGPLHSSVVSRIDALLQRLLPGKAIIFSQSPIVIPPYSEPEPDVAVVKPRTDFYAQAHPQPEDIYWLIEVADTTLEKDRLIKGPLYAEAGITHYWIVNLPDRQLEVYTEPQGGQYKLRRIVLPEESVSLPGFRVEVNIKELLG